MRLAYWIVALPVALAIIVFAVTNREEVAIDLWPLAYSVTLPVFAVVLIAILIGFIWGGVVTWLGAGRSRQRARELSRRLEASHRDIAVLQRKIEKVEAAERQATIPQAPADAA